jgi:hypothetical protein
VVDPLLVGAIEMIGKKRLHVGLLMLVLAGATWVVHAEVYKWVDADGKIQYGDEPPKGVKAQKVTGGVTVLPAAKFTGSSSSAAKSAGREENPAENSKTEAPRQSSSSASSADAAEEARRKAVARCEKNRGTDCQDEAESQTVLPSGEVFQPMPGWSRPPIRPSQSPSSQASSNASSRHAVVVRKVPEAAQSGTKK